jgi:branched-chain amino acid transport system permease protein
MNLLFFSIFNGFIWGLILVLVALGLNLFISYLGGVNLAHGDFYMLGAIFTWFMVAFFGLNGFFLSIIIAFILFFCLSFVIRFLVFKPVEGHPINPLLISLALSIILQQIALIIFGGIGARMEFPIRGEIQIFGYNYPVYRILVGGIALGVLICLWVFLYMTDYGLKIRACAENRDLASASGIPSERVLYIVAGLSLALAAISGVLASSIVPINYLMGADMTGYSLLITIIGGIGSLEGTILTALIFGLCNGILSTIFSPTDATIISYVVLLGIILFFPRGIFGGRGR